MGHARSQIIEHIVNSNAETTDARLTATLARFYCDDLRIIHCQTVHTQTCSVKPVPEPTSLFSVFSQPEGRSVINHLSRRSPATAGRKRINSAKERGSHGALRFLGTWTKSLRPQLLVRRSTAKADQPCAINYRLSVSYSFTSSIRFSTTWLVKRSMARCTQ